MDFPISKVTFIAISEKPPECTKNIAVTLEGHKDTVDKLYEHIVEKFGVLEVT